MKGSVQALVLTLILASQGIAFGQTHSHRPVSSAEVSGIDLGIEGTTRVAPGESLHWLLTLYDIVGPDSLRPAARGRVRVLTSFAPDQPVAVLETDAYGRAQVEIPVPNDQVASFNVILEAVSSRSVQRHFMVEVETVEPNRVQLLTDREAVAPGERITIFGRVTRRRDERPLGDRRIDIVIVDEQGRALSRGIELSTGDDGGFFTVYTAPDELGTLSITARLESGERAETRVDILAPAVSDLYVAAAPERNLAPPGAHISLDVIVRRYDGRPVEGAIVLLPGESLPRPGIDEPTEPLPRTDASGRVRRSWRVPTSGASATLADLSPTIRAVHPGLGLAETTFTVRVAREPYQLGLAVEGGALIPGLPSRVYLRVVAANGLPAPAGAPVVLESELLGTLRGSTNDDGVALLEGVVEVDPDAVSRDLCGGTTASAATLTIGEGPRSVRTERCLPVDPDATVRVRVATLSPACGETVTVSLLRAAGVRRQPAIFTMLASRDGYLRPLSQQVVPSNVDELEIAIPEGVVGEVLLRVRPLIGTERQEVRGGSALLWVAPEEPFGVDLEITQRERVAISVDGIEVERRGLVLVVPRGEGQLLLEGLRATRDSIPSVLPDTADVSSEMLAGTLAARTPRDVAVPAVWRDGEIVPLLAPESPVHHGVLRDPWRARARFVRGRLGLVMRAIELYAESCIPHSIENVAMRGPRGWSFNRELLNAVAESPLLGAAGASGLGGSALTLEDLEELDSAFSFDNMARRLTRERLLRVLIALRSFVRQHDLDLHWSRNIDPSGWLPRLEDHWDDEMGMQVVVREQLFDGWGRPFAIRPIARGGRQFSFIAPLPPGWELVSAGPDGRFGTRDDMRDPFARVLPSGGVYAEAVAEDDLLARLNGVELGQATINRLLEVYDATTDVNREGAETRTAELGWVDILPPIPAPIDLDWFERSWLPRTAAGGHELELSNGTNEIPMEIGQEPREFDVVGIVSSTRGWSAWSMAQVRGGVPVLFDASIPPRLGVNEPLEVAITAIRLPGGPPSVQLTVHPTGSVNATLSNGSDSMVLELAEGEGVSVPLHLSAQRSGSGALRFSLRDREGNLLRELEASIRVVEGGLLRSQIAATALDRTRSLSLTIPSDAEVLEGRLIVSTAAGMLRDPRLAEWVRRDPALVAWSHALHGEELPSELTLALGRMRESTGLVNGELERLSTACALVAWAASSTVRHEHRRDIARSTRWLRSFHGRRRGADAERGRRRSDATILAALVSAASGLPDMAGGAADPLSAHVGALRDDVRNLFRTDRSDIGLMARGAGALLLIDSRDTRGRGMLTRAREHLAPGIRGGLVVDTASDSSSEEADSRGRNPSAGEGGGEQIAATAALAIAAIQVGEEELAADLARGLAARAHLALELGGEPLFWLLAASVYGVFGREEAGMVSLETGRRIQTIELDRGFAVIPLESLRSGGRSVYRLTPTSPSNSLLLARLEATYIRPQAELAESPLRANILGDTGYAGERAAMEITVENTGGEPIELPVLLVSLPPSAELDERARTAMEAAEGVSRVAEVDGRGVVEVHLEPIDGRGERIVPLPVRWRAAGGVRGFGLALFDSERAWDLSVTPPRDLAIVHRRSP